MARHEHYELIKEWIEDTSRPVQYRFNDTWEDCWPDWDECIAFRFKPEEGTWTPCKSGKLRFLKRQIVKDLAMPFMFTNVHTTSILQQLMVNQKGEYKWMDVPIEEEDNG